MGNPTPTEFKQLRESFDGSDQFMRGSAVFGGARSRHTARVASISITDPWSLDDEQVRLLLLKVFPRAFRKPGMKISRTQRKRARQWMAIIQWYFRQGLTANRVALRLRQEEKRVEDTVRRMRRAAAGLRTTGKLRTTRGRPKSQPEQI